MTRIRTLDDLRHAKANGLKKGDPIILGDDSGDVETSIFFGERKLYNSPAILTIERDSSHGVIRGLYMILKDGLYYQAHCQQDGEELRKDTEMYNKHFLF